LAEPRWLVTIALLAVFAYNSRAALAQNLVTAAADIPDLPVASQPQPADIAPVLHPTPEEVGDSLMWHRRYQAAIETYKKSTPASASVLNKMGIAYHMMFSFDLAERCYKAALKLNPKNARVLNNLGSLYVSLKQLPEAERMYRKAVSLEPGSAILHKNLGTDLLAEHRYSEGWDSYQDALAIDPHVFESTAYPRIGNPVAAQDRGAVNYYLARGCVRAGMNDRAIDHLRAALNDGFTNAQKIKSDSEFAALRNDPAFAQLLAEQSAR
jgi:tetratricopeptide (TPR) repeat protein